MERTPTEDQVQIDNDRFLDTVNNRYPSARVYDDTLNGEDFDDRDKAWFTQFAKQRHRTLAAQNNYGSARADSRIKRSGQDRYLKRPGEARKPIMPPPSAQSLQRDASGQFDPVGLPGGIAIDESQSDARLVRNPYNSVKRIKSAGSQSARTEPIEAHRHSRQFGRPGDPEYADRQRMLPKLGNFRPHVPRTNEMGWWPPVEHDVDPAEDRRQRTALKLSYRDAQQRSFIPHDLRHMLSP